jgi:PAS domain S-box-containing protein
MTWVRLRTTKEASIIKLTWILPTVIFVLLLETCRLTGVSVPMPFFILIGGVILAGLNGGMRVGFAAGVVIALFVIRAYFVQYGPPVLTGSLPQVFAGSAFYILFGTMLGRMKDQKDTSIQSLRELECLRAELLKDAAEKGDQAAKVAESEARLDAAIRIAGIGYFSFDIGSGDCTFCSEQHAAHLGLTPDEFRAGTAGPEIQLFYIHADDRDRVLDALERIYAGENKTVEYRAVHPNGEIRYIREFEEPVFDENGKVVANVGTSIDLTELREAEAQVRQSQRIEAIGTLTGGVAHDFNNLLAIILGNLELCLETGRDEDWEAYIQTSIDATMRGAGLTKNLLSFARRAHLEPTRMNLNQTIQNTMKWASRVLPATISVENSLMTGLWDVELDATSIENALINILLNARDAMPDGGKVTIETANMRISEEYVSDHDEDIEPGCYVILAINDTGHGISPDKTEKVFEPFYTSKSVGQGSGLGLSMVQGFAKQSGGAVRIYSEVGVGTTLKLYFKASEQKAVKPQLLGCELFDSPKIDISILVTEDEEELMRILKRILEGAGYSVTVAENGDKALEVYKSSGQFDLLLTDVVMPGKLQGPGLAKAIQSINPDIPCIFLSGYASEATVHDNGLKPSDIRLMKPVSRLDLLRAVSKALEPTNDIE